MKRTVYYFMAILAVSFFSCNENTENMDNEKYVGINPADMDTTVNPGDDFNAYANGGWMKNNPLPDDKSRLGTFDKLADKGEEQVRDLIQELAKGNYPQGSIEQKIGMFYSVGMDTAKIEKEGYDLIKPMFADIDKLETSESFQSFIAHMHKYGISPFFNLFADADAKNSEMIIAQLYQGGLGMGDRDYYTVDDERMEKIRTEYKNFIKKMFMLLDFNESEAQKIADDIMELETNLAQASMTRLERRDPFKTYNKMNIDQLRKLTPVFDWKKYFENIGLPEPGDINVNQPDFFKAFNEIFKNLPHDVLKNYLKWNLIRTYAPYLSDNFVNTSFEFYGKVMSGSKENRPRWKRVIQTTNGALSEAIGQKYVEKYFPPEAKERMIILVNNLKEAYKERIKNLTWMSDSTKAKAIEKLEAMNVKVGYPDKWRDYSGLDVKNDGYVLNVMRSRHFEFDYMLSKINKPVDKQEWHMPPQMVNAYYDPSRNEIVFPAAILQPPFFYMDADDAVNYGAIGVVIGHEMTHGFDDQGRNYDKNGNLNDWWTQADAEAFKKLTDKLVDQFNQFIVLDTIHANGKLTLGENIADLGGLNIAYTAMQKAFIQNPPPEKIDGFTPEQRFFLSYAHVWAQNIRDEEILRRTKEDVHSLGKFRVNGPLPNMDEFYKAFYITEKDSMYIKPENRVKIW